MEYKVFFTGVDGHALPALLWVCGSEGAVFERARTALEFFDGLFSEVTVVDETLDKVIFRLWN